MSARKLANELAPPFTHFYASASITGIARTVGIVTTSPRALPRRVLPRLTAATMAVFCARLHFCFSAFGTARSFSSPMVDSRFVFTATLPT